MAIGASSGAAHSWLVGEEAQEWFTDSNIQKIRQAGVSLVLLRSQQPKAAHHSTWPGPAMRSLSFQAKGWQNTWPWHPPPGLIWFAGAWIVFEVTRRVHYGLCHVSHRITKWLSDAGIFFDILHILRYKTYHILSHATKNIEKHQYASNRSPRCPLMESTPQRMRGRLKVSCTRVKH